MKTLLKKAAALFVFAILSCASAAQAQSNGKGAFVAKYDYSVCMTAQLTGLSACLEMTQTSYVLHPNGKAKSVFVGQVPATGVRTTFPSSWQERGEDGVLRDYTSSFVVSSDGSAKLTLNGEEHE
ncbi:hypothetical protein [Hymenobacter glacialis]|uniref:hypothetical protein n=1 Tax=Hymenobacter glacialis TaxID=1908236 RepID=UPI000F79659E|nr:hypothetical protein [Hymenobacter glacialis]